MKSSIFTIDWQTKSQSFGFELRFVLYDLAVDGQCPNSSQYHCRNRRCIDRSLICSDEDFCGDQSYWKNAEHCPKSNDVLFNRKTFFDFTFSSLEIFKTKLIPWQFFVFIFICFLLVFALLCIMKICQKYRKSKEYPDL